MEMILIPLLAFLAVMCVGGALLAHRRAARAPLQIRLQEVEQPLPPEHAPDGGLHRMHQMLRVLGHLVSSGRISRSLRDELVRAGYHSPAAPMVYLGIKIALAALGLLGAAALLLPMDLSGPTRSLLAATAAFTLFLLPNLAVSMRHRARRLKVRLHLPDAVDLLEVCVSAGMGLDMAWNVVGDEIRPVCPVLADEMALVNLEIHLGAPRVEAMRHLADRTGVDEIGSLVAVLVQSERFGTSMATALRVFATTMRETRSARAEETAEKMAVRMLFPMVLFVFPAMFIVTVGPAVISLIRSLGE